MKKIKNADTQDAIKEAFLGYIFRKSLIEALKKPGGGGSSVVVEYDGDE